jgi:hypothetical protein
MILQTRKGAALFPISTMYYNYSFRTCKIVNIYGRNKWHRSGLMPGRKGSNLL